MRKSLFSIILIVFVINLVTGYYNCHEIGLEKCDEAGECQSLCFCSSHIPAVPFKNYTFLDLSISNHNLSETNDNFHKNLFLKSIEHPPRIILS